MNRGDYGWALLLIAIAFTLVALTAGSDGTEARTVMNGDVVVDHDLVWADDVFEVRGNVTVRGGIHLTVLRATVEVVGTFNGSHWFNASAGSTLTLSNGTIKGSPHPVGVVLGGSCLLVDSTISNVWTTNATPAIELTGAAEMIRSTVEGAPDSVGLLVNGSLDAESCTFRDLGLVSVLLSDPTIPGASSFRNCTFAHPGAATDDTTGLSVLLTSSLGHGTDLLVSGCTFTDLTNCVEVGVNTSNADLSFQGSRFTDCTYGLSVAGNKATLRVVDCSASGAATAGFLFHDVLVEEEDLVFTTVGLDVTSSGAGIQVIGHVLGYQPRLVDVNVTGCTYGVQSSGATVHVEDSVVLECVTCFYAENKGRVEVRRTEHTHRSAEISTATRSAVVAFSTVNVTACRWAGAQAITDGLLYLHGEDGVELERVDLADPQPLELVTWSLTKYNDLGRLWVVPSIRVDDHEFKGGNFSIYNTTPQQVEVVDHLPPVLFDLWPEDGHWYAYTGVDVTGRLVENGSGMDRLIARVVGGQEREATVLPDGNWSVTFDPVEEGALTIELEARDATGGLCLVTMANLTVDVTEPDVLLNHDYIVMGNGTLLVPTSEVAFGGMTEPHCQVNASLLGFPPDSPRKCFEVVDSGQDGAFEVELCPGLGYHAVLVRATDRAGNVGETSFDIGVDTLGPSIWIHEPEQKWPNWFNTSEFRVHASVGDEGASEWFKVWVDDEEVEVTDGVVDFDVVLGEGEGLITIRAEDQAGHAVSDSVRVMVDTVPPDLRVVAPVEDEFFTMDQKVDLQGEVSDANLDKLTLNGTPLNLLDELFSSPLQIAEGENVFVLEATDLAGNSVIRRLVITRDVSPPGYTYRIHVDGGQLIDVDGEAYATGPEGAVVWLRFDFNVSEHTTITASGGLGTVEGEGDLSIQFDLEEGENPVTFTLVDEAGNTAPTLTYRVTLDTTPPEMVVPGSGSVVKTEDRTYLIKGRVEVGSTLTVDGAPVKVNVDGSFATKVDLVKGENVFRLEAKDAVGLNSTIDVTVDREVEEESPGPGAMAAMVVLAVAAMVCARTGRRVR